MNIILIDPEEIDRDGMVILNDRRSTHIIKILGVRQGDTVRIGIVNGPVGQGRISAIDAARVVLEIKPAGALPPPRPSTDLILALPRPIMLKRILVQTASLGVGRIFIVNANRVEKSYFSCSLLKDGAYRKYLRQGLEQAVDTRMPELSVHGRFRPFVEDLLPEIARNCPARLVAHPQAAARLADVSGTNGRVLIAIGPEGGWVDFEIERFRRQGFKPVSLGPRILRVDTAVPAILAQIDLLRLMSAAV